MHIKIPSFERTRHNIGMLFICSFLLLQVRAQQSRPNIVIIVADDMGWGDVGFHGSEIRTPHIDQLAREGVILNRYYVSPICSPTRTGIMTGRLPERYGLRENVIAPWLDFGVDTAAEFLPQMLAQAGYKNRAAIGKWHLGHSKRKYLPLSRGFTHFYGHYNGAIDYFTHKREGELDWHNDWEASKDTGYTTDLITGEAVRCIGNYKNHGPFFLYIAYNAPHGPLQAKEADLLQYGFDPSKPVFGKEPAGNEGAMGRGNTRRQTYAAMVTAMDAGIGRIMEALRKAGIEKNTLVLFQSDNGAAQKEGGRNQPLRGFKFQEWEGGVRVPAVIRWPAGFKGGWTSEQVAGYIDIAPTLREIAGIRTPPPQPYDGVSILKNLKAQRNDPREFYLGNGTLIKNGWKLVAPKPAVSQTAAQLFAIDKDPYEKENLVARYPGQVKTLMDASKKYQAIIPAEKVPPYEQGRATFKAPPNWDISR
ncbi:arylsulfatase [Niabella sp. CC-SYL272]|uniref:arylsulfatase B n=1 Tax=Niabella agricola TaxID=2891571 RepID=UPI001F2824C0|nr:arylsulfatase [Niabella agricola]MCF3109183.1 arylsulfatase [Niabella agricola]